MSHPHDGAHRASPSGVSPLCTTTEVISLDHGWSLARTTPGAASTPAELDALGLSWHPAVVPGTVAAAFPDADPQGWTGIHDIDSADWWYRCTFATPPSGDTLVHHDLVFHGLATIAEIWLNGTRIAHVDNMFVDSRLHVTRYLHTDGADNDLLIRFASLHAALATRKPRPRWRTKLVERQQLRWIRTSLLGRIVGWAESPQPVGPWRPVTLESHHHVRLGPARITPSIDGTDGILDVSFLLVPLSAYPIGAPPADAPASTSSADKPPLPRATLVLGDTTTPLMVARSREVAFLVAGRAKIPNVHRWWPHTHGAQPRYDAKVILAFDGGREITVELGKVAFRTVTLDTENGAFTLHVNGTPIFCRGACWTPLDTRTLTTTPDIYRHALNLARNAGMNMLRVGGTMMYESDSFYELCDELGILIWQEFMFSNMDYPDEFATPFGTSFAPTSVTFETEQLLRRLQTRASLALLCGNNEVQQQAAMVAAPRELWNAPLFAELLPKLCAEHAPGVPYWSSSPSGGTLPFHVNSGDAHYFGYGPYLRTFDDVRTSGVRFASETLAFANVPDPSTVDLIPGGTAGAGHHPAWKRAVPRDNGAGWDFEDVRDHYVEQLFKEHPPTLRRTNPDRYLALGRVASGEVMARTIGSWRRSDSTCRGALVWWFRDMQIGAGWGLLDALQRPKAAYYYFRRVARPVALVLSDEGLNGIRLDLVNDTASAIEANLRVTLYRDGLTPVADATTPVELLPRQAIPVHADALFDNFVDPTYAYRFGPPGHNLVVATLTDREIGVVLSEAVHFPLGHSSLGATSPTGDLAVDAEATKNDDGSYTLRVSTNRFAQSVAIDADGFLPDDNYFHVPPSSSRTTVLRSIGADRKLTGTVTPLNSAQSARISVR